ncbi:MAG: hypothetical protein ACLTBV_21530, partial [Enterocloster bolteae]
KVKGYTNPGQAAPGASSRLRRWKSCPANAEEISSPLERIVNKAESAKSCSTEAARRLLIEPGKWKNFRKQWA